MGNNMPCVIKPFLMQLVYILTLYLSSNVLFVVKICIGFPDTVPGLG